MEFQLEPEFHFQWGGHKNRKKNGIPNLEQNRQEEGGLWQLQQQHTQVQEPPFPWDEQC